jgi:hypothetical protein
MPGSLENHSRRVCIKLHGRQIKSAFPQVWIAAICLAGFREPQKSRPVEASDTSNSFEFICHAGGSKNGFPICKFAGLEINRHACSYSATL